MAKKTNNNPFAFRPWPVTFWSTAVYLALLIPLVIINEQTPPAPPTTDDASTQFDGGVNLTQAWLDLDFITRKYHPYNSRYNDEVRGYLMERITGILEQQVARAGSDDDDDAAVEVFDDMVSNSTFLMSSGVIPDPKVPQVAAYFEGTNILVYIRGKQDDERGRWWETTTQSEKGLVMVNAHYDSVSTGYGATDNGMGVVTALQLIRYFSHPSHRPDRGLVVVFNNAEEDYLYGARALGRHPLNRHIRTFLNLEGAGAGGRAMLFRTTDREVTAAYASGGSGGVPHPFGSVLASDAFGMRFIRSATDYEVFYDVYGQRGLDLAFFKPRARYHTNQDDARHASRGSLWHMLSAAVPTTEGLVSGRGAEDEGPSKGVWFDLFGSAFVLFGLRTMFAWSLTLLIASPLVLLLVSYLLLRADKYYLFGRSVTVGSGEVEGGLATKVSVGGWKGFFRFPFALLVAGALTFGAAFLLNKVNPFVIYGNRYTVLAMMFSLFYFVYWAIMRGADFARPSALHRVYVQLWLFLLGWAMLVAVTVAEDRLGIGAGYMFVFFESAVVLSLLIALCELFVLPKKGQWARKVVQEQEERDMDRGRSIRSVSPLPPPAASSTEDTTPPSTRQSNHSARSHTNRSSRQADPEDDAELPTERTPLIGGLASPSSQHHTTFATTYRRSVASATNVGTTESSSSSGAYEYEQPWSARLPTWTWLLQFLLLGPMTIILVAQVVLLLVDATHQTASDGSASLLPYLIAALGSVLVLLPLTPFAHRVTHHLPLLLLAVFAGMLVFNLVVFPFSEGARYKAFFVQKLDLDGGDNRVCYDGVEKYLRPVIAALPSAAGKELVCGTEGARQGLVRCCFDGAGLEPKLAGLGSSSAQASGYGSLISINATSGDNDETSALIEIRANNTKACVLEFDPGYVATAVHVKGSSGWDEQFGRFPEGGVKQLRLWHREWDQPWVVEVEWAKKASSSEDAAAGLKGAVVCMWSDANEQGTIPALDEALQFVPAWSAVTKSGVGLVEGRKRFEVSV